jgi:Flp pilus assembly protein TadG
MNMIWKHLRLRAEKGAIIILTAFLLPLILVAAGFAIDLGNVYIHHSQLQNMADAAALAGASKLGIGTNEAKNLASAYVAANQTNLTASATTNLETPWKNDATKIRVTLAQDVPLYFLHCLPNVPATINIAAHATAAYTAGSGGYSLFDNLISAGSNGLYFANSNGKTLDGKIEYSNSYSHQDTISTSTGTPNDITLNAALNLAPSDLSAYIQSLANSVTKLDQNHQNFTLSQLTSKVTYAVQASSITVDSPALDVEIIIVDGNASNFNYSGTVDMKATDKMVILFSLNGDISLSIPSGSSNFRGIVYAPNGTVIVNGNGGNFYGSIVGKRVEIQGGSSHYYYESLSSNIGGATTPSISLISDDE